MNQPILFGAAYYPEDWSADQRAYDIEMMKKAGMNVMRFGEFAWHNMEPRPGEYDFAWLHEVVDELAENGIKSILGTPTATPPRWFLKKYPDAAHLNPEGYRTPHGGRRHCCSNNPDYQRECARIVEKMGQEFGADPNVIGWQLDNEIYSWGEGCVCPVCEEKFHRYLEKSYQTIDALNQSWNLNLFSQAYDAFDEIPIPVHGWQSPHLRLEWDRFRHSSDVAFIHSHVDILRRYTKAPIGTDMMPFYGMGYEQMNRPMDVIQFNHYHTKENISARLPLWYDHFRTFGKPFWNTETATCWNGSEAVAQVMKPEGFCRINSWLPVALGGEANLYWLWRQHWAGHELIHGSVLYANGRPMHIFKEVQKIAREFELARDFLRETRVQTQVGLHFTNLSWQLFRVQSVVSGLDYGACLADDFYLPLTKLGLRPDVLGVRKELKDYKVIISPLTMTLEDEGLGRSIEDWVRAGGTWVVGPMTDIRTAIGTHYIDRGMGRVESMTGVRLTDSIPGNGEELPMQWSDGTPLSCKLWQQLYERTQTGQVLAAVTGGYSTLQDKAVIQKIPCGQGWVWLLGTIPSEQDYQRLIRMVCREAGVELPQVSGTLTVVPRRGEHRRGLILMETAGEKASYTLKQPMTDILTGRILQGELALEPYDLFVLEDR